MQCGDVVYRLVRHCYTGSVVGGLSRGVSARWHSSVLCAPSLSVLSWCVDASMHSHRGYRRRFSFLERVPYIDRLIRDCEADVVALQDSSQVMRHWLCRGGRDKVRCVCAVSKRSCDCGFGVNSSPLYRCVTWAKNGKCGEVQLFVRTSSPWCAAALDIGAGASMQLSSSCSHTGDKGRHPQASVVVTNVDLSYRGKSLGRNGLPFASPDESLNGSPFVFHQPTNRSSKQQMDAFRELAMDYISAVNRPDVLVGNFYMSSKEYYPAYADAWVLAGSPSEHERTTNTFLTHRKDKITNAFYFSSLPPSLGTTTCDAAHEGMQVSPALTPLEKVSAETIGVRLPLDAVASTGGSLCYIMPKDSFRTSDTKTGITAINSSAAHTFHVPHVAGRYQRCFLSRSSSRTHKASFPFSKHFSRVRVVVPRSMVMSAKLSPLELSWLDYTAKRQGGEQTPGRGDETAAEQGVAHTRAFTADHIECAPSEQYPLLVHMQTSSQS